MKDRATLRRATSSKQLTASAVDFRRIWCDTGLRTPTVEGITIWRPVPPDGYCSLGARCAEVLELKISFFWILLYLERCVT